MAPSTRLHSIPKIPGLLLLVLLSACSSLPHAVAPTAQATGPSKPVYLVSHGWHTGIVVPAADVQTWLPRLTQRFAQAPYIEFGWGDKGFYQAREVTTGLSLRAMFWSSGSVIHAVAVPGSPVRYFSQSEVRRLCLDAAGHAALLAFVTSSFERNAEGELIALNNGLYGDSQFYEGIGKYHVMNTCNKWTAKALQSAGLDLSATWMLTAGSVMRHDAVQRVSVPSSPSGQDQACPS